MSKQEVILCKELENDLTHAIGKCPHDKLFLFLNDSLFLSLDLASPLLDLFL